MNDQRQPDDLCIERLIKFQSERIPFAVAIAAPKRPPLTYNGLWCHMAETMGILRAMGVGRNDRIAIALPNGPEMAVVFLAVAACATAAPLNPEYRAKEFDFYLSDLNAKALIVQSGIDSPAIVAAQRRGIPVIELSPLLESEAGMFKLTGKKDLLSVREGFSESDDVALLLHTSGTTSRAKLVPLTQANICTSAHNIRVALELGNNDRYLNVMPLYHIHGLMTVLSSLAAGGSVFCTSRVDLTNFFNWMEEFRPTWYSAAPTLHHAILAEAKCNRSTIARCPLRFIRSASSALSPRIMAELETIFNSPVIEAYAMTEASHQISSNSGPLRKRKVGSVGIAVGPEVAIMGDLGNLLSHGNTGEIVIRGANVMRGYENNPAANKISFIDGWFRTGDQGYFDRDGHLFITGRLKEIINRGGEKISPREVDEVLMEHPAVVEAATFAVSHRTLGEDVAAAVVVREHVSATESEIRHFVAARLVDFKVPRHLLIVDEIPKGATGKLQRLGLAEKLGLTGFERRGMFVLPRDEVESRLSKIWEEILGVRSVGVRDDFFELGGHSLLAMRLLTRVEKEFSRSVPLAALFERPTVEKLADLLRGGGRR